ncbi:MAG TPA: polysaccharide deacetylase family protein, partial [Ktedonobacteraceae bacterium]|nr:polysaccharide deacetylase family protein [Ktedonobacteraceae bacterium]
MSTLSQPAPKHKRRILLIIGAVFSVLLLISGGAAYWIYSTGLKTNVSSSLSVALHKPEQTGMQVGIHQLANQYMNALLAHDYAKMWSLLQPQIQQKWGDEGTFATFWEKRFQAYNLQRFTLAQGSKLASWTDPENMQSYQNVQQIQVSLQLQPKDTAKVPQVAEALQPSKIYQNLPFIAQQLPAAKASDKNIPWAVLAGGPADLEAPILPTMLPALKNVNVPILMYHHISNIVPTDILGHSLTVNSKNFVAQLDYLQKKHYHTITFNQLFNALYYGAPLPRHPIILTFDDGYTDSYTWALPALKQHGFSGTFYI